MIRTIIDVLLVIFFFFVTIPVLIIFWLIGLVSPKAKDFMSINLMKIAFAIILFTSGVKVKIEGLENIPRDRAVLYVGNHRSYFDIIVAYKNIVGPTGFMAKKEFFGSTRPLVRIKGKTTFETLPYYIDWRQVTLMVAATLVKFEALGIPVPDSLHEFLIASFVESVKIGEVQIA